MRLVFCTAFNRHIERQRRITRKAQCFPAVRYEKAAPPVPRPHKCNLRQREKACLPPPRGLRCAFWSAQQAYYRPAAAFYETSPLYRDKSYGFIHLLSVYFAFGKSRLNLYSVLGGSLPHQIKVVKLDPRSSSCTREYRGRRKLYNSGIIRLFCISFFALFATVTEPNTIKA